MSTFSKGKVNSIDYNNLNNSLDVHLQEGHGLTISQSVPGNYISIVSLESGIVWNGPVSSFNSNGFTSGYYRIINNGFQGGALNSNINEN